MGAVPAPSAKAALPARAPSKHHLRLPNSRRPRASYSAYTILFFFLFSLFFFSTVVFSRRPGRWGKGGRRPILLPVAAREIGKERGGDVEEEEEEESGDSFFFLLRRNLCIPCCADIKKSV